MISPDGYLIETGFRCKPLAASTGGQVETAKHPGDLLSADQAVPESSMRLHGRADARPSRSAVGAGSEGTGHTLAVRQRGFFHVAVQV